MSSNFLPVSQGAPKNPTTWGIIFLITLFLFFLFYISGGLEWLKKQQNIKILEEKISDQVRAVDDLSAEIDAKREEILSVRDKALENFRNARFPKKFDTSSIAPKIENYALLTERLSTRGTIPNKLLGYYMTISLINFGDIEQRLVTFKDLQKNVSVLPFSIQANADSESLEDFIRFLETSIIPQKIIDVGKILDSKKLKTEGFTPEKLNFLQVGWLEGGDPLPFSLIKSVTLQRDSSYKPPTRNTRSIVPALERFNVQIQGEFYAQPVDLLP